VEVMMKKKMNKEPKISTAWLVAITAIAIILFVTISNPKTYEFKNINTTDFVNLYNSSERSIIYIGTPTCSYCQKFEPVLKDIADEYDLDINYYNLANVSDDKEMAKFSAIDSYFTEEEWGTPLVVITDNQKLDTKKLNGYHEKSETVDYFKETGFIK